MGVNLKDYKSIYLNAFYCAQQTGVHRIDGSNRLIVLSAPEKLSSYIDLPKRLECSAFGRERLYSSE
jgi:hypothetical protein